MPKRPQPTRRCSSRGSVKATSLPLKMSTLPVLLASGRGCTICLTMPGVGALIWWLSGAWKDQGVFTVVGIWVYSHQEPYLDSSLPFYESIVAFLVDIGGHSHWERARRSERTKAGLQGERGDTADSASQSERHVKIGKASASHITKSTLTEPVDLLRFLISALSASRWTVLGLG